MESFSALEHNKRKRKRVILTIKRYYKKIKESIIIVSILYKSK